jgi:hypothetical protein
MDPGTRVVIDRNLRELKSDRGAGEEEAVKSSPLSPLAQFAEDGNPGYGPATCPAAAAGVLGAIRFITAPEKRKWRVALAVIHGIRGSCESVKNLLNRAW